MTEAGAFEAIVETMGHDRLLYGTDFHVSHLRGRCIAIGDSFHWLYAEEMGLEEKHTYMSFKATLAHTDADITLTAAAARDAFTIIKTGLDQDKLDSLLVADVKKEPFRRQVR